MTTMTTTQPLATEQAREPLRALFIPCAAEYPGKPERRATRCYPEALLNARDPLDWGQNVVILQLHRLMRRTQTERFSDVILHCPGGKPEQGEIIEPDALARCALNPNTKHLAELDDWTAVANQIRYVAKAANVWIYTGSVSLTLWASIGRVEHFVNLVEREVPSPCGVIWDCDARKPRHRAVELAAAAAMTRGNPVGYEPLPPAGTGLAWPTGTTFLVLEATFRGVMAEFERNNNSGAYDSEHPLILNQHGHRVIVVPDGSGPFADFARWAITYKIIPAYGLWHVEDSPA